MLLPAEGPQPEEESLTVVRIKRRRDELAVPEIILESVGSGRGGDGGAAASKRPRAADILLQFQGLGVIQPPPVDLGGAGGRRRFVHVHTLGASAFKGKNDEEVLRAASALRQADTGNGDSKPKQAGAGLPRQPVKAPPTDSEEACRAGRRAAHQQASQAARYKQVRRRREGAEGAGASLNLYDLEARQAHGSSRQAAVPPKQPTREELLLRDKFGPMLDEYLGGLGLGAALPREQQQQPSGPAGAEEEEEKEEDDEFVYDVYVPVGGEFALTGEQLGTAQGGGGPNGAAAHDGGAGDDPFVPVVEVAEDDDELYWAMLASEEPGGGLRDEDHDSEDSNAESYYANSYPDEDGGGEEEGGGAYGDGSSGSSGKGSSSGDEDEDGDGEGRGGTGGGSGMRLKAKAAALLAAARAGGGGGGRGRGPYRTEADDYSAHSSEVSEEAERDDRERLRRGLYMH